ncbi:Complex 1 LYR protein [Fagus crenata]
MITKLQKWPSLSIPLNLITRHDVVFIHRLLHNGPDTVEELLDRHVVKKEKPLDDDEAELETRRRLTSTRREALSLYRDILRASRFFMWPDSRGVLWRDVLRENARKEFEDCRFESDPEIVTRLLIGGRDAVQSALDKLAEKQREQIDKERGGGDQRPVSECAGTVGVDLAVPATPAGCMSMADVFKL